MPTSERAGGYDVDVVVDYTRSHQFYLVKATANGTTWEGFPVPLQRGPLGQGPSDEWLNFTDLMGDDQLATGDFFRLENLRPDTEYEIALLDAMCATEIASAAMQT